MRFYMARACGRNACRPILASCLLLLLGGGEAQFSPSTQYFADTMRSATNDLENDLMNLPALDFIYFPSKYQPPRDYYELRGPDPGTEYTMNVLFDPCRNRAFDCCKDTYGTNEYLTVIPPASAGSGAQRFFRREDGSVLLDYLVRTKPRETAIVEACTGPYTPYPTCTAARLATFESALQAPCFNNNATVLADASCRAPSDGSLLRYCVEIAVTQTSYIHECGGEHQGAAHCGTYLEVHRPGFAEILSTTQLKASFNSGYRMAVLSLVYQGTQGEQNASAPSLATLCYDTTHLGKYEVWWVKRTLDRWLVEKRIPFQILSPLCDWDGVNNRYLPFATVGAARSLVGLKLFDESRFLFSRQRVEGLSNNVPGPGMGAKYVPRTATSYPTNAVFTNGSEITYTYTPILPEYTVRRGILEPPNIPPDTIGG